MATLTKRLIDAAKLPAGGQMFLRDGRLQGFALRVTANGAKAFVVEKRIHGRPRRFTIGAYGVLTVDQARKLAIEKMGDIASGNDPATERQRRRHSTTWLELEQHYLERHAVHKKSISNDVGMLNKWLADWRTRRVSTITRVDICTRHAEMGAAGHKTWGVALSIDWLGSFHGHAVDVCIGFI
jgi:hypothetical protein